MGNCCPVATIIAVRSATLGGVVVALVMERGHVRVAKKVCCWCSYSQCIPVVLSSVFSVCSEYVLSCTEDVPACGDTCDKVLSSVLFPIIIQPLLLVLQLLVCGVHRCTRLCHAGSCGQCLQMSEKACRCGKKTKLVPCSQEFLCESRCSNLRQCGKHYCKRKVSTDLITSLHTLWVCFV